MGIQLPDAGEDGRREFEDFDMPHVTCRMSHAAYHMRYITYHMRSIGGTKTVQDGTRFLWQEATRAACGRQYVAYCMRRTCCHRQSVSVCESL